jgi:hypothetical protein
MAWTNKQRVVVAAVIAGAAVMLVAFVVAFALQGKSHDFVMPHEHTPDPFADHREEYASYITAPKAKKGGGYIVGKVVFVNAGYSHENCAAMYSNVTSWRDEGLMATSPDEVGTVVLVSASEEKSNSEVWANEAGVPVEDAYYLVTRVSVVDVKRKAIVAERVFWGGAIAPESGAAESGTITEDAPSEAVAKWICSLPRR